MKNSIEIERIWQDESFFGVKISCSSDIVTATTKVYMTDESVTNLSNKIKMFINSNNSKYVWENGEKGSGTAAFISLEFSYKDRLGHVLIEVYMELEDGGDFKKHNCCFYLET